MHNIGERIRSLRKENALTQDELAAQLHVTRQTVSNYENGKSEPDLDMPVRIADALAGLLPIDGNLPACNFLPTHHFWLVAQFPKLWYTLYALCGAGLAITNKKNTRSQMISGVRLFD